MSATLFPRRSLVRRRWPSAAFLWGVIAASLIAWRVAASRSPETLPPAGVPIRVIRAIDGDTLLLEGNYRVRLLGVNTPETKHPGLREEPFGAEAFQFTQLRVDNRSVTLEFDHERLDNYRRVLAYVYLDTGSMLNEQLVKYGMSPAVVSFPIRSDRQRLFEQAEREAQRNNAGIWALPNWQARLQEQRERDVRCKVR